MNEELFDILLSTLEQSQTQMNILRDILYQTKEYIPRDLDDFYDELPSHSAFSEIIGVCEELKGDKTNALD